MKKARLATKSSKDTYKHRSKAQRPAHSLRHSVPLCVDLDDSLIKTDLLHELTFRALKSNPFRIFSIITWWFRGISVLKTKLAELVSIDPSMLPYHEDVYFFLQSESRSGRKLILATGSPERIAQSIANYLGIFSEVISTTPTKNMVGSFKSQELIQRFGEKGFDYIGDSNSDLEVWRHSRQALVVSGRVSFVKKVNDVAMVSKVFERKKTTFSLFVKAMRPHQWVKNILVFIPLILAHQTNSFEHIWTSIIAFLSFCFVASSIYIINDLADLDADRAHHDKKNRPFASGDLALHSGPLVVPVLWSVAMLCCSLLNTRFALALGSYVVFTTVYTFWLKRVPIADIMLLSCLYSIRLVAGGVATNIVLSPWLIAFSGFLFISLALIKRCSELLTLQEKGLSAPIGRGYDVRDVSILMALGSSSGFSAVVVLAIYINAGAATQNYTQPQLLWVLCPALIFWLGRIWYMTSRNMIHSDPVKFALTDQVSWLLGALVVAAYWAASGY